MIDNQPLTSKEKQVDCELFQSYFNSCFHFQRIPRRRNRPAHVASAFPLYSPSPSPQGTTSESTTEPESILTNSSGTFVARRYILHLNYMNFIKNIV
jgi:hypothetical protein